MGSALRRPTGSTDRLATLATLSAGAAAWLVPSRALADGGGSGDSGGLALVVALSAAVGFAYLMAHFVVDRLQQRFLVVAGAEYLLLGALLGPAVPQIPAFEDLSGLMPVIALAAGWVGLLRGTELRLRDLASLPRGTMRIVFMHHLVPGIAVAVAAHFWFQSGQVELGAAWQVPLAAAAAMGCCAAADSTGPFDLLASRYHIEGDLAGLLRGAARFGDVLIIAVFGVLLCVFHEPTPGAALQLSPTEWSVVTFGLGIVLGLLFTPFLGGDESPNGRFLTLVGMITFASGSAFFLDLSPLLVNLCLGFVIVHTSRVGAAIHDTLAETERPLALVLIFLAGALWRPSPLFPTLVGIVGFVGLRLVGKLLGSRLAAFGTDLRRDLYRGLLAHGEVTVAMAVSFRLVYEGPAADIAYSVVLASLVLHDILAPRMLRALLVDAGQLRRELGPGAAATETS